MFSHVSIHPVKSLSQEWVSGTDPFSLRGYSELSSQVKSRLKAFTKPADIRRNSEKEAGKSSILSTTVASKSSVLNNSFQRIASTEINKSSQHKNMQLYFLTKLGSKKVTQ